MLMAQKVYSLAYLGKTAGSSRVSRSLKRVDVKQHDIQHDPTGPDVGLLPIVPPP